MASKALRVVSCFVMLSWLEAALGAPPALRASPLDVTQEGIGVVLLRPSGLSRCSATRSTCVRSLAMALAAIYSLHPGPMFTRCLERCASGTPMAHVTWRSPGMRVPSFVDTQTAARPWRDRRADVGGGVQSPRGRRHCGRHAGGQRGHQLGQSPTASLADALRGALSPDPPPGASRQSTTSTTISSRRRQRDSRSQVASRRCTSVRARGRTSSP